MSNFALAEFWKYSQAHLPISHQTSPCPPVIFSYKWFGISVSPISHYMHISAKTQAVMWYFTHVKLLQLCEGSHWLVSALLLNCNSYISDTILSPWLFLLFYLGWRKRDLCFAYCFICVVKIKHKSICIRMNKTLGKKCKFLTFFSLQVLFSALLPNQFQKFIFWYVLMRDIKYFCI